MPEWRASLLFAHSQVRRRILALIALGVLAGLGGGLALAALAGARRTDSAYDRLREATLASDAIVFATQAGVTDPDWSTIAALDEVETVGAWSLPFLVPAEPESLPEAAQDFGAFAPFGEGFSTSVDRPVVDRGRLPDQAVATEVLLNEQAVKATGFDLGSEITMLSFSEAQFMEGRFEAPEGPVLTLKVVGVGHSALETTWFGESPFVWGTEALYGEHPDLTRLENAVVRLEPGASVPDFAAHAAEAMGIPDLPVADMQLAGKRVTNATRFERDALFLFALAVAVATLVLVGQALSRSVRAGADDMPTLAGIGLPRPARATALALPHVIVLATGCLVAVGVAIALSPRFPIAFSRTLDPDVGVHADWLVIIPGVVFAAAVLTGATLWIAQRAANTTAPRIQPRPSRLARFLQQSGAPLPVGFGVSLALESGSGRRALPTRPAMMAIIAAVAGIVAAITFGAGIDDALAYPERFGSTWDLEISSPDEPQVSNEVVDGILEQPAADAIEAASIVQKQQLTVAGRTQPTYSVRPVEGVLLLTVLDGRSPTAAGEVVVGPATMDEESWRIGDTVSVDDGGSLTIVGTGFLPQTPHSGFDQGLWVTVDEAARHAPVTTEEGSEDAFEEEVESVFSGLMVRFDKDADEASQLAFTESVAELDVAEPTLPADLRNLENVRTLPAYLAAFLVALGLGALVHMAGSVVRRRRGDLAVLRALGMTPRQARRSLGWQGITLTALGVAFGVPLGLIIGRTVWRVVAESIPMVYVPPLALAGVALTVIGAFLVARLLVAWPARSAGRVRPGPALRSE